MIFCYLEGMFLMGSAVVRSIWKEKSSAVGHHSNTFLVYLYAGLSGVVPVVLPDCVAVPN